MLPGDGEREPVRLFIGIELPEELKEALGGLREELGGEARTFRWARPAGLHLTLRFLGEDSGDQQEALKRVLSRLTGHRGFGLRCEGVGVFGGTARPRVLWAGVVGDLRPLTRLQEDVERRCIRLGWPPEERSYRPHITLARGNRPPANPEVLQLFLDRHSGSPFGEFRVSSVALFSSVAGPGGSVYTPLHRVALA